MEIPTAWIGGAATGPYMGEWCLATPKDAPTSTGLSTPTDAAGLPTAIGTSLSTSSEPATLAGDFGMSDGKEDEDQEEEEEDLAMSEADKAASVIGEDIATPEAEKVEAAEDTIADATNSLQVRHQPRVLTPSVFPDAMPGHQPPDNDDDDHDDLPRLSRFT